LRNTGKNSGPGSKKFSLINQGCRLNAAESQKIAEELQKRGWVLSSPQQALWVIVNTCTVTHRADADLRKIIRRVKRENPGAKIAAIGCYVDHYGKVEGADLALPNHRKTEIINLLGAEGKGKPVRWKSRGFLKVQEGCDLACTYCIIPRVRGPSRSLPWSLIERRIEEFLSLGYQEVVITGIHLESYGREWGEREGLLHLLRLLEKFYPQIKFRISSLDPRFLSSRLLDYILNSPHIMPTFHLSLQHYSPRILKLMGRGSNRGFARLVDKIRKGRPEAGLGADFIVGFPSETDEDFLLLYRFAEKAPLSYFHVFTFSPRERTRAAEIRPRVPERISKKRSALLRELGRRKTGEFARSMVGKTLQATVIKEGEALSENYLRIKFEGKLPPGKRLPFKIEDFAAPWLLGKPLV